MRLKVFGVLANISFWFLLWFIAGGVLQLIDSGARGYTIIGVVALVGVVFSSLIIWDIFQK